MRKTPDIRLINNGWDLKYIGPDIQPGNDLISEVEQTRGSDVVTHRRVTDFGHCGVAAQDLLRRPATETSAFGHAPEAGKLVIEPGPTPFNAHTYRNIIL